MKLFSGVDGVKFVVAEIDPAGVKPWVNTKSRGDGIICGISAGAVMAHFNSVNDLLAFCEQNGIDIAPVLDQRERAFYEMEEV